MKQLVYISLMFFFACCAQEDPINNMDTSSANEELDLLEIQWATRMELDKEIVNLNDIIRYKNFIINSGDSGDPTTLYFYNKTTGDVEHKLTFDDDFNIGHISTGFLFDNIYIVQGNGFLGIDLETRLPIWKNNYSNIEGDFAKLQKIDEQLFIQRFANGEGEIYQVDIMSGNLTSILKKPEYSSFSQLAIYDGELFSNEIALFNHYEDPVSPPEKKSQDIIAVDLSTSNMVWQVDSLSDYFACNIALPPIIYDDLVITGGDWSIYAFDILTGEQVWKTEIAPEHGVGVFDRTHHLLYGDRLYVNEAGYHLTCLNPTTGEIIWDSEEAPNCSRQMIYNEEHDLLIMTSWGRGSILIFDALTGELLHTERGFENSTHSDDVIYDPESDLFFADTYKHTMAFKLNYSR